MTDKQKIKLLRDVLEEARDHLDYCSYGDPWERECAQEKKLEEQIINALRITNSPP